MGLCWAQLCFLLPPAQRLHADSESVALLPTRSDSRAHLEAPLGSGQKLWWSLPGLGMGLAPERLLLCGFLWHQEEEDEDDEEEEEGDLSPTFSG